VSATATLMTIPLDRITLDPEAWPREALDEERVELFAELLRDARAAVTHTQSGWVDPLPPLVVVDDGRGGYVLADGWHRCAARRRLGVGFDLVQGAVYQPNGQEASRRAYELALMCTLSARPLTTAEKRAAIARLIAERAELSDRAIARLVGVSHRTVGAHRAGAGKLPREDQGRADMRGTDRAQSISADERFPWEIAAARLADDLAELLRCCRKLFGGADFRSAGRELYEALANADGDDAAVQVIDQLGAVVASAHACQEGRNVR
jgi:hypothetical protein